MSARYETQSLTIYAAVISKRSIILHKYAMKTLGRILLTAATTTPLVFLLLKNPDALQIPLFGLSLNLFVMCWYVFVLAIWQYQPSLGGRYYKIRQFEEDGTLYAGLGVRYAKKLLQTGPLSVFNPSLKLAPGSRDFHQLERKMRGAETAHALLFVIMLALTLYPLVNGWWAAVASWTSFNVLINAYPVMLQRFNRARVQQILHRSERHSESRSPD